MLFTSPIIVVISITYVNFPVLFNNVVMLAMVFAILYKCRPTCRYCGMVNFILIYLGLLCIHHLRRMITRFVVSWRNTFIWVRCDYSRRANVFCQYNMIQYNVANIDLISNCIFSLLLFYMDKILPKTYK